MARIESVNAALRRMLSNGPLTGWPKRPADQDLLVHLAALRFTPDQVYTEKQVNETLSAWLATFVAPYGIDHVTMRRMLVDARMLARDKQGAKYVAGTTTPQAIDADPANVMAQVAAERKERKQRTQQHAA
jgi:hypothetical protein